MKLLVAVTTLMLSATGCAGSASSPTTTNDPCDFRNVAAEVVSEPEVVSVPEGDANLVLDLSSTTRGETRVTIFLDRKVALDVRTPAVSAECSHSPVFSHGFRLSGDSVRVAVQTDQDRRRTVTVPLDGATRWVAVQPQEGFATGLDVFDREPAWG